MRLLPLATFVLFACETTPETKYVTDRDGDGIAEDDDCNDEDAGVGTPQTYYADIDHDGHGDGSVYDSYCDRPVGYVETGDDCDDADADVYPGAEEACDGKDNDCDGTVDNGSGSTVYYADTDGDGYGDDATTVYDCSAPEGYVDVGGDCNDADTAYNPGALEEDCEDPNDYNCDGSVGYADNDGDGYAACSECDDSSSSIFPGALEYCNEADDDCDGEIDEDDAVDTTTWYADLDGDGFGDEASPANACDPGEGWVADASDCDDSRADINPMATEVCNDLDDDCDALIDDADDNLDSSTGSAWYTDADADGYGDSATSALACDQPTGTAALDGDCNDADTAYNPGASETDCTDPNDYNCDGSVGYADDDGDGYAACAECDDTNAAINPAGTESCDDADNDCDGEVDESTADDASTWYADSDTDGYGDDTNSTVACDAPSGYVADNTDCNDTSVDVSPAETEVCNGIDDNCDGAVDEATAVDANTWYVDADSDGFGDAAVTAIACDSPSGYVGDDTDCDDAASAVSPVATEYCDGIDNNCDGSIDEDASIDASTWYADADNDGYGDASTVAVDCEMPSGYVADDTDCDDAVGSINPGADERCNGVDDNCNDTIDEDTAVDASIWYADADDDGFGSAASSTAACAQPSGYVGDDSDCDDNNDDVNPLGTELCDEIDNNCDGTIDEDTAADASTWYADVDEDGYGDMSTTTLACSAPLGFVGDDEDCDDTEATTNPAATEYCDGVDNDCDGSTDENSAADAATWYLDSDTDGYGDAAASAESCSQPSGYVADATDCDDTAASVNPAGTEYCNGEDDDCDGDIDDDAAADALTWYDDSDTDGYGDAGTTTLACAQPSGYVADDDDCNDSDGAINPAATEYCDGVDNDCDGSTDENSAADASTWYDDGDNDGYGDAGDVSVACDAPSGHVANDGDCNDSAAAVNPAATEACDGIDNDCDGSTDEAGATGEGTWYADDDGDGYGDATYTATACDAPSGYVADATDCEDGDADVNPGEAEVCNTIDDDCDGDKDETGCPSDCATAEYGDHVYMFCDNSLTWSAGRTVCQTYGYDLTTVNDSDENIWMVDVAYIIYFGKWWTGYNDVASEGSWVWANGETTTYTNWHSGEPNNVGSGEDCMQLGRFGSYTWNDEPCDSPFHYICEE